MFPEMLIINIKSDNFLVRSFLFFPEWYRKKTQSNLIFKKIQTYQKTPNVLYGSQTVNQSIMLSYSYIS